MREKTGQRKPVFLHILRSESINHEKEAKLRAKSIKHENYIQSVNIASLSRTPKIIKNTMTEVQERTLFLNNELFLTCILSSNFLVL